MGPVSAFGFSVCGWVRFEARGWRGRGGDRLGHPGRCAGRCGAGGGSPSLLDGDGDGAGAGAVDPGPGPR